VQVYCPKFLPGFRVLQQTTVSGTFTLIDSIYSTGIYSFGSICWGTGGFSDIRQGTQVTVTNGAGTTLTTAAFSAGTGNSNQCVFKFSLPITEGENSYIVSVSHRGTQTYTFPTLVTTGINMSLGS
jgi:hypothetical protein